MSKAKSTLVVLGLVYLIFAGNATAHAHWSVSERSGSPRKDFVISRDEAVNSLENQKLYVLVEYGVISKIFIWDQAKPNIYFTSYVPGSTLPIDMIDDIVFVAKMPDTLAVNYFDTSGEVKAEPINHGDNVAVVEELPTESVHEIIVPGQSPVQVISSAIASDYSTSVTIAPISVNDPNKSVEVQVITNGVSFTSVTTDNSSTPITIDSLPSNSFISVQTVIRDKTTNEESVLQNVVTKTPDAQIPTVENARDVAADRATIIAPSVVATTIQENGGRSATIAIPEIAHFDANKSRASLVVVGPGGSTTSIGVDGNGGTLNVRDLGVDGRYTVTLVIRDLDSGEETFIRGTNL